jgi:Zn-dependent protease with chaperone function
VTAVRLCGTAELRAAVGVEEADVVSAGLLAAVAFAAVAAPLADAAVSRRSELAADRYAVNVGVGHELARALAAMEPGGTRRGWVRRLLDRHPPTSRRVDVLCGCSAGGT